MIRACGVLLNVFNRTDLISKLNFSARLISVVHVIIISYFKIRLAVLPVHFAVFSFVNGYCYIWFKYHVFPDISKQTKTSVHILLPMIVAYPNTYLY